MTPPPKPRSISRRNLLAGGAAVIAMPPVGASCSRLERTLAATPDGDVRASLQAALLQGDVTLDAEEVYWLSGPVRIPRNRRLSCIGGTRILYLGAVGSAVEPAGVFVIDGDDVKVEAVSGELVVECAADSPYLWAVLGGAVSRVRIVGVRGRGCGHVRLGQTRARFADISTAPGSRDICRDITILGGGASFSRAPPAGEGACLIAYALGWTLRGASYHRVAHGVQWWGGNAWPGLADGAPTNERKCADFTITDVSVEDATFAGIWGSMGRDGRIRDCRVAGCGDVGFDAEGCHGIAFDRCDARDAVQGCFTVFFLNRDIVFTDCTGLVTDRRRPLFRCYNVTQSSEGTGLIAIRRGRFECRDRDGSATLDTAAGPTALLEIIGATLVNARIDTANFNMHRTRIADNQLSFPFGLSDEPAIRAGHAKMLGTAGGTLIENNRIVSAASRPSAASAIHIVEDDFNSSASDIIGGNTIEASFANAIAVENASRNIGMRPRFLIKDNVLGSTAGIRLVPVKPGTSLPQIVLLRNRRVDGRPVDRLER